MRLVRPCRGEPRSNREAPSTVTAPGLYLADLCAFEDQEEAERVYAALGPRLEKFGLTLAAEKTRILLFSRQQPTGQGSVEFLGFEFRWGWDRAGKRICSGARRALSCELPCRVSASGARRIAIDGSACCLRG